MLPKVLMAILTILIALPCSGWTQEQTQQQIEELIKKLGDPSFEVREQATEQLRQIGPAARTALEKATHSSDPEVVWRARRLLQELDKPQVPPDQENEEELPLWEPLKDPDLFEEYLTKLLRQKLPDLAEHFDFNAVKSLRVVVGAKTYTFVHHFSGIAITVKDRATGESRKMHVPDLKTLAEEHPQLYRIYIENGGNSLLWRLWRGWKKPPELKEFEKQWRRWHKRFKDELPPDLQRSLKQAYKQWEATRRELFRREERFKNKWHQWSQQWLPPRWHAKTVDGVVVSPLDPATRAQLQIPPNQGLVVREIKGAGLLAKAGLARWDVILKINGDCVARSGELMRALQAVPAGDKLQIVILRRGRRMTLETMK